MSTGNESLDDHLGVRISGKEKAKFLRKCKKLKKSPGLMLRECIVALNEGRLSITPTKEEQELLT